MEDQKMCHSAAQYLSLKSLFDERMFEIPDYQRGYSWTEEQVSDLLNDIDHLRGTDARHFTGTVVATRKTIADQSGRAVHVVVGGQPVYDVVDGQQRLTTLILIMRCICDLDPTKYKADLWHRYFQRGDAHNEHLVLRPNGEIREFYEQYVIRGQAKNAEYRSHHNIMTARKTIKKRLEHKDVAEIDEMITIISERLWFVFFTPDSGKEVGLMFEVINNRGRPLSELEKIKNYFIYYASVFEKQGLRENVNNKWGSILRKLNQAKVFGQDEENSFLRYAYLVFFDTNKAKSWHVYQQLKQRFSVNEKSGEDVIRACDEILSFITFLDAAAENYAYLRNGKYFKIHYNTGSCREELGVALKRLRCHPFGASILPLFLTVMCKDGLSAMQRNDLLNLLEILNFRVYVLPRVTSRSDSKQGDLYSYANSYYHLRMAPDAIYRKLREEIIDFTQQQCPRRAFVQHLTLDRDETDDYYDWKGIKYFLGRYEEHLQKEGEHRAWNTEQILKLRGKVGSGDYISTEHIWARGHLADAFDEYPEEKRRLGNFVLMALRTNVQLQDKPVRDKVEELLEKNTSKLSQVHDLGSFLQTAESSRELQRRKKRTKNYYRELARKIADLRETELIRFALQEWRIDPDAKEPEFDKVDSFEKPERNEIYYFRS